MEFPRVKRIVPDAFGKIEPRGFWSALFNRGAGSQIAVLRVPLPKDVLTLKEVPEAAIEAQRKALGQKIGTRMHQVFLEHSADSVPYIPLTLSRLEMDRHVAFSLPIDPVLARQFDAEFMENALSAPPFFLYAKEQVADVARQGAREFRARYEGGRGSRALTP